MNMRNWTGALSALLLIASATVSAHEGHHTAVQTMAGILTGLNHFPSDADKQSLKQIVEDKSATADERTVAQALMNVEHKVSDADKAKLEAILEDQKASGSIKTLAGVILGLNHTPSEADKKKLQALAS
jgi:hypothetical protein